MHRRKTVTPNFAVKAIRVLRVLCREEFSISSARTFVEDIKNAMEWLTGHYIYTPEQVSPQPESRTLIPGGVLNGAHKRLAHSVRHPASCCKIGLAGVPF